ncbi:MAG: hypothetical protein V1815_00230 [Candidatus Woesearchaeota archaeon]
MLEVKMGYYEEKEQYESQKELAEGSRVFHFNKVLDIHPKRIEEVFDFFVKDNKDLEHKYEIEKVLEYKRPNYYESIWKEKRLFGIKSKFTFELQGWRTKIRLIITISVESWNKNKIWTKNTLKLWKEEWETRIQQLYDNFGIIETKK